MAIDIRATCTCSLGTLISASISDDYIQGSGLIKVKGNCVINGIITPDIGTVVTFAYAKGGVTTTLPRKLRVLSSFADPFRRTTTVELGCKLTYLQDLKDPVKWEAFDDDENNDLTAEDAQIITIPIHASSVMAKCLTELGITASSNPLTNKFSIAEFDFGSGYVQVLSDLLVSESYCGYLDTSEELQVFSLNQDGGTGPVLDSSSIIDLGPIGIGQLPGEAVAVSYSSLKLKEEVSQSAPDNTELIESDNGLDAGSPWYNQKTSNIYSVSIEYRSPVTGEPASAVSNILEVTTVTTKYKEINTISNGVLALPVERITLLETRSPAIIGSLYVEYLSNGIGVLDVPVSKQTVETFEYDPDGIETLYTRYVTGGFGFLVGAVSLQFVFGPDDFVSFAPNRQVEIEYEVRSTIATVTSKQVTTWLYGPWFKTQNGQQAIASARDALDSAYWVERYLDILAGTPLAFIDQRVEIVSDSRVPVSAPTRAQLNAVRNANGVSPSLDYRTESKAELELAVGSAMAQRRIEFSLPYAPDDTFYKSGSSYYSAKSDAAAKANLYGRVQNKLLLGNRSGMNVQVAPERLPEAPFSPVVVSAGGVSGLYRTNGTSYTMDANGIVASSDLLFSGGAGGSGTTFFPVAPGITTLPEAPTVVNTAPDQVVGTVAGVGEDPQATLNTEYPTAVSGDGVQDTSTNRYWVYDGAAWNDVGTTPGPTATVPAVVPVWNETVLANGISKTKLQVTSFAYALNLLSDVTVASSTVLDAVRSLPAASIALGSFAPDVRGGASVAVPSVATAIDAVSPDVFSGASVSVPAAGVALVVPAVENAGPPRLVIQVASLNSSLAALTPDVAAGASVAVPLKDVAVAAFAPSIPEIDPSFSSVSLLLHMDGSNGSTTFTDSSSNARSVTAYGTAQISTSQSKFGGASALLDGNGDYLQLEAIEIGSSTDCTMECWFYRSGGEALFGSGTNGNVQVLAIAEGQLYSYWDSNECIGGTVTSNTWHHAAITRSAGTIRLFLNGVQVATSSGNVRNFNVNSIGRAIYRTDFNGYIDDVRITVGVARYTSNFTPPVAAFPDS